MGNRHAPTGRRQNKITPPQSLKVILLCQKTLFISIPSPAIHRNRNLTRSPTHRFSLQRRNSIAKFLKKYLQNLKPVHPRKVVVLSIKIAIMCAEETDAEAPPLLSSGVERRTQSVEGCARRTPFVQTSMVDRRMHEVRSAKRCDEWRVTGRGRRRRVTRGADERFRNRRMGKLACQRVWFGSVSLACQAQSCVNL